MLSERILLAYDGSEQAKRALAYTVELAKLTGAKVGVVSVVPVHAGRIGIDPWDDREVHTDELIEAKTLFTDQGIEPALHESYGEVAEQIVKIAVENGYDHVVVGSRHLGPVERVLQGSVSEGVVNKSPVTVTIIH